MSRKKKKKKIKTCLFLLRPRCLPGDRFLTVLALLQLLGTEKSPAALQRAHHPPPTTTRLSCFRPRGGSRTAPKCLPESARQCPGRAASSKSPSSSGGRSGGASWDRRAPELLTPWKRAAIPPAPQSPRSRGRSLGFHAAGPALLGPWGFASCGAIGTVHTSRPLPRFTRRRGAQPSAHRSSPGISGHGPGVRGKREARAARSSCLGPGRARRSRGFTRAGTGAAWGFPRCGEGGTGGAPVPSPGLDAAPRAQGCETRKPAALARAACHPPPPLRRGLCPRWFARSLGSGSGRECYCSSELRLIDKEST